MGFGNHKRSNDDKFLPVLLLQSCCGPLGWLLVGITNHLSPRDRILNHSSHSVCWTMWWPAPIRDGLYNYMQKTRDNVNDIVQCDAKMDHIGVTADNGVDVLSQPCVWVWYFL